MTLVYLKGRKTPLKTTESIPAIERRLFHPRVLLVLDERHRSLHPDQIRDLQEAS